MSGSIRVSGETWSAATWLFDWILAQLASSTDDPTLEGLLREITEENLSWLAVNELPRSHEQHILHWLREKLLNSASDQLPQSMTGREGALAHLRALADMVSE
jgi:hypothetical protein